MGHASQRNLRTFDKPTKGRRIAVKVINHLGDEVMKVFRVEPLVLCNPWNWELARASGKPRWNERGSMGRYVTVMSARQPDLSVRPTRDKG